MNNTVYDSFQDYHPLINFIYFTIVIGSSMLFNHPIMQTISLLSAVIYAIQCEGKRAVLFSLKFGLPVILLTAFVNPAFSHEGVTRLLYLPTGNPLTLESILYGFSAGFMLAEILIWFSNFNRIITSDKFVYLFGRIIPALSLVLSMTLRFLPKFKKQMKTVTEAQKCIGRDISMGNLLQRTKTAATILSIMVTWSLENAIETADSMKSRGYGLKGRTAFSIYRFDERDQMMMLWFFFCGLYLFTGTIAGIFSFRYFPSIRWAEFSSLSFSFYLIYFLFCITPVILNKVEEEKWNDIYSKM